MATASAAHCTARAHPTLNRRKEGDSCYLLQKNDLQDPSYSCDGGRTEGRRLSFDRQLRGAYLARLSSRPLRFLGWGNEAWKEGLPMQPHHVLRVRRGCAGH